MLCMTQIIAISSACLLLHFPFTPVTCRETKAQMFLIQSTDKWDSVEQHSGVVYLNSNRTAMTLRNNSHLKHTANHFVLAFPGHCTLGGFGGLGAKRGLRPH